MDSSRRLSGLPAEVEAAARRIGANIRVARRRRRISQEQLAARMFVSRPTLRNLERGDPNVSAGVVYSALWALGLIDHLERIADPASDDVGLQEELRRVGHGRGSRLGRDVDF